jgi:hypothetical protein
MGDNKTPIADIVRKTATQLQHTVIETTEFYMQLAEHIEHLEATIKALRLQLADLESLSLREYDDHK